MLDTTSKILIVEDHESYTRTLARQLANRGPVEPIIVGTLSDALDVTHQLEQLDGAIVDLRLPDGDGVEVVAALRDRWLAIPVMLLTAVLERGVVNRVQALGAAYVCKPASEDNIAAFFDRVRRHGSRDGPLEAVVSQLVERRRLSPRETEVLRLALRGVSRHQIPAALGIADSTVKTHVRALLRKTHAKSLVTLARDTATRALPKGEGVDHD